MNKKIFTLLVAFLATMSMGVSAQTAASAPLENGQYYLLSTGGGSPKNLAIDGDSLTLMDGTDIATKAKREAALWQVDYTLNPDGSYAYSFTNKKYGQLLALSEGKAGLGGAISSFGWLVDPTTANGLTAIAHAGTQVPAGFDKVSIYTVFRLTEDAALSSSAKFSTIPAASMTTGYEVIATKTAASVVGDFKGFKDRNVSVADMAAGPVKIFLAAGSETITNAGTLKKGTVIFVKATADGSLTPINGEHTFQAADVDKVDLMNATAFTSEIAPLTSSAFKFDATTTNANVMAANKFVPVQVYLPVTSGGIGATDVSDNGNYTQQWLLKVDGRDEYLAVDTAVWVDEKGSPYHKLITAPLRDRTGSVTTAKVSGREYYQAAKDRMAAAYLFAMDYYPQQDSLVIAPKFNLTLFDATENWATDTIGDGIGGTGKVKVTANTGTAFQQVSLKKFSSATELTLVGPAYAANKEIPSKISFGVSTTAADVADIASGVYFINLVSTGGNQPADNGKYYVDDMLTRGFSWKAPETQDFNRMPGAHWVVEKSASTKQVSIWNRESGEAYKQNTIFYKNGDNVYAVGNDTLKLTKVDDAYTTDSLLGYFAQKKDSEDVYSLTYFSGLDNTKRVLVKDKQLFVDVEGAATMFAFEPVGSSASYGVDKKDIAKRLERQAYRLYVMPENKYIPAGDTVYVQQIKDNQYYVAKSAPEKAARFYAKEFNNADSVPFYALWDQSDVTKKVSVKDVNLLLRPEDLSEVRTSTFAIKSKEAPLYRRLGVTNKEDGFNDLTVDSAKFYVASNPSRFLYENSLNAIAGTGDEVTLNFLGEFNEKQFEKNAALFVDTAYVRGETKRPQYLLGLKQSYNEATECPVCGGKDPSCTHHDETYRTAKYLVSLEDSIATQPTALYEGNTRLAFVQAKHIDDNLIISDSKFYADDEPASRDTIDLSKNEFNKAAVQFRLVKDDSDDFKIEFGEGQYLKIQNGVPVLTSSIVEAEVFNLSKTDESPVANEEISTTDVEVVAVNGAVIIKNAAGKTVAISNILGKTLASTAITSDEATIAVPAGIVVVAVEGEAAVKAVVK